MTSLGIAVVALGTAWIPLSRSGTVPASSPSSVSPLSPSRRSPTSAPGCPGSGRGCCRWRCCWGGGPLLVAAAVDGRRPTRPRGPHRVPLRAVAHAAPPVLSVLPAVASLRAQLSSAAAGPARPRCGRLRARARDRRLTARPGRAATRTRAPDEHLSGRGTSVDERDRAPGATTSSTNAAAPRMTTRRQQVVLGEPATRRALPADRDPGALEEGVAQLRERRGVGQLDASAPPGTAVRVASPVSHRLTSTPEARAVAATVKPWSAARAPRCRR